MCLTLGMSHGSNSKAQKDAENEMIKNFSKQLGIKLASGNISNKELKIGAASVQLDGFSTSQFVLVEVVARIGPTSSSRDDKVMSDCIKMLAVEKAMGRTCQKFVLFADPVFSKKFDITKSQSWNANVLKEFDIKPVVINLSAATRKALLKAQIQQSTSNEKKKR